MPPLPIEAFPVVSHSPLRTASFIWREGNGQKALTLVCKVTFELCPDISPLAQKQDAINSEDIYGEGDERGLVRAPSDIVPFKRRADVLVAGHAYAPPGAPARSFTARLAVGSVKKTVAVQGGRCLLPAPPAGMGPIAPEQPHRAQKLGRSAASWDHRGWHARPLPGDIDAGYFNSAPPDQQVDIITPDERIELENLHPDLPRLSTRLQAVVPRAVLRSKTQPERPINLRCDTLWIDADRGVCCVTWRGSVPLPAVDGAEIHVTAEGLRLPASDAVSTVVLNESLLAAIRGGAPSSPADAPVSLKETAHLIRPVFRAPPLPFAPAAPGTASVAASSGESRAPRALVADGTATLTAPILVKKSDLPFHSGGPPAGAPSAQAALQAPSPEPEPAAPPHAPLPAEPFGVPRPAMMTPIASAPEVREPSDGKAEPPLPPPMLGAIAPESDATSPEPAESAAPIVDPEAFPIEWWAEIVAEIDKEQRPRAELLQAHGLIASEATVLERHYKDVLQREAASGGFAMRFKHDAAYVAALERLRGRPLSAAEYARILAAGERRQLSEVLRELEMPPAAHLPIVRQWTAKLARDPRLSFEMIQAVAAIREGAAPPMS